MNTMIASAVGLAKTPQFCSARRQMERRLKRAAAQVTMALPLKMERRNQILAEAWRAIHWLCGFEAFVIRGGSIGNTAENDIMKLLFNATAITNIADNAASSPLTNLEVSLHTADPGEA